MTTNLSFHNTYSLLKKVDRLLTGPSWTCKIIEVTGDKQGDNGEKQTEILELWIRDPVKYVEELISNPIFKDYLAYAPKWAYNQIDGGDMNRVWDEMWTGNWWWDTQVSITQNICMNHCILTTGDRENFLLVERLHPLSWHQTRQLSLSSRATK